MLLVLIIATAWVSGGQYLIIRQLWMDEVHSWLVVTDKHQSHAMDALADGIDFNPPMWFLVTRWLTSISEPVTELRLRLLSVMWMLLALSGLYLLLLREFTPNVCIAAVLLTASHPLLIHQAAEIRFYGFWCACAVWLCNAVVWQPAAVSMQRLQVLSVFALAVFTTTCHYFGILSISLLVLPLIVRRSRDKDRFRLAIIAVTGGISGLVYCGKFLIGQKAALSRPTWISPTTLEDSLLFLQALFPAWQIIACAAGLTVSMASAKRLARGPSPPGIFSDGVVLLPCLCLAGMPLMIISVAWCLQPALVTRYAIVGIIGFAPMFAIALKRCSRSVQNNLTFVAVLGLGNAVSLCVDQWTKDDVERSALIRTLVQCPADALIVFEDRIRWMPVLHQHPELASRCVLAEFTNEQMTKDSTLRIIQRDVGRRIQKWYPQYEMMAIASLAKHPLFFVVPYSGGSAKDLAYPPGYSAGVCSAGLFRFERDRIAMHESSCTEMKPERQAFETRATR